MANYNNDTKEWGGLSLEIARRSNSRMEIVIDAGMQNKNAQTKYICATYELQ